MPCGYKKNFGGVGKGKKVSVPASSYTGTSRTWAKQHKKHLNGRRRGRRRHSKKLAIILKKENDTYNIDQQMRKETLKKAHAKQLGILRHKFFCDIYALWEKHEVEMNELNCV
jgi:hypothetical protein